MVTINKMLHNKVYIGTVVWTGKNGEVVRSPTAHVALIIKEDFDNV